MQPDTNKVIKLPGKVKLYSRWTGLSLIALLCLWTSPQANTDPDSIHIATESWNLYTSEDGTGLFLDITRAIYEPRGIRIETVIEENVYMPFASTDRGRRLAQIYDDGLALLIESGELRRIFARYELEYPFAGE